MLVSRVFKNILRNNNIWVGRGVSQQCLAPLVSIINGLCPYPVELRQQMIHECNTEYMNHGVHVHTALLEHTCVGPSLRSWNARGLVMPRSFLTTTPGTNTPLKLPRFLRVVVWTGNVLYAAEKASACSPRVNRFRRLHPTANLVHETSVTMQGKQGKHVQRGKLLFVTMPNDTHKMVKTISTCWHDTIHHVMEGARKQQKRHSALLVVLPRQGNHI